MSFDFNEVNLPEDSPNVMFGQSLESSSGAELPTEEPNTNEFASATEAVEALRPYSEDSFFEGYSRTPTYIDQYERLPGTIKEGALQAMIYDLMDPAQLIAYNKLLAEATCVHSPRAVLTKVETQTVAGGWKVLAHYKPLWYKLLNK